MKVLLLRPPIVFRNPRNLGRISTGVPVGLLSVAASTVRDGHEVHVFDAVTEFDVGRRHGEFQALFAEGKEREVHFGAPWEEIRETIRSLRPDVVGIGNQYTDYLRESIEAARIAKEVAPRAVTVTGGPHATVSPETFIHPGSPVDYAVLGEGERSFPALLAHLSTGSPIPAGVAFLENGRCGVTAPTAFIEPLDDLPLPAYHLVEMERYFQFETLGYRCRAARSTHSPRSVSVTTSRGCPHRCVFCSIHLHMGRRWRPNSVSRVLDHLRMLTDLYRVEHVYFEDDNLTVDRERFVGILDGILARKLRFTWSTPNGVRADTLSRDILRKCRETGCRMLGIGIESGDQRVLDEVVRKRLDLGKVEEIARLCREARIDLHGFFVVGMPGETKAEIRRTFDFALHLASEQNVLPCVSIAKPLIGTEMHRICREKGFLTDPIPPADSLLMREQDICMRPMIRTGEFDLAVLEAMYGEYYRKLVRIFRNRLLSGLIRHPSLWWQAVATAAGCIGRHGFSGVPLAARKVATLYWDRLYAA